MVSAFIYNEAGEKIAVLAQDLVFSQAVQEFLFQDGQFSLTDAQPSLNIILPASAGQSAVTLTWQGLDLGGKAAANGDYILKIQSVDPAGVATVLVGTLSVLRSQDQVTVSVFSEAGELVYSWNQALSGLSPSGVTIQGTLIDPSLSKGTPGSFLSISLGSSSLVWNGRDSSGQPLANGSYLLVVDLNQDGSENVITDTITVLNSLQSAVSGLTLNPNPVAGSGPVELRFALGSLGGTAKVYTVSGELVKRLDYLGDSVLWDLKDRTGSPVSAGLYLILAETRSPEGRVKTLGRLLILR